MELNNNFNSADIDTIFAEIPTSNEKQIAEASNYDTSSVGIGNMLAELSVPYNDNEVLTNDTEELRLVNYFFDSISSHNKEVETLLYEIIGYSLTRTAKLNKAFTGRPGVLQFMGSQSQTQLSD